MNITVILCTYNRFESLKRALQSVAQSAMPPSIEWEVLVVDNNSSDRTSAVVEEFIAEYPGRFRYKFEPKPGKSHALNSGISSTSRGILAFMDDDVEVDPHWLDNLTRPFANNDWAGTGGRILPEIGFVSPRWLETGTRYSLAPLAIFDLGSDAGELTEAPFGTNMAFRAEMFSKYGGFRTDLGPRPGSEIRNEDSDFGSRLLDRGERFWYVPSAVVYHSVSYARIQKSYFLRWWFDKARGDIRQDGVPKDARWFFMGVPISLFRRLLRWTFQWMLCPQSARRFSCKMKVWSAAGAIRECYRQSISPAPAAVPAPEHGLPSQKLQQRP